MKIMNRKKKIFLVSISLIVLVIVIPLMMQRNVKTDSSKIGGDYYLQEMQHNMTLFQTFTMPGNRLNGVEVILTDFDNDGTVKINLYKQDGSIIDTAKERLEKCENGQFQEIRFSKRPFLKEGNIYYIGISVESESNKAAKTLIIPSENGANINGKLSVDSNMIENSALAINYDYQNGPISIFFLFVQIQIIIVVLILANYIWKSDFGKKQSNELLLHLLLSGFLIWMLSVFLTKGQTLSTIMHQVDTDQFMDFFNSIQYGRTPYEKGVIYPPLANLLYAGLGHIIPVNRLVAPLDVRNTQMGGVVFYLYSFIVSYFLVQFMHLLGYQFQRRRQNIMFDICILFSVPFLYSYERGNIILLCLVFCMSYCYFNEIGKRKKSYVGLALAIGIKIYPAVYGLMEVRKKKNFFTLVFTSLAVFMLPFMFFPSGSFAQMLANITRTSAEFQNNGVGLRHDLENLLNIIRILSDISISQTIEIIVRYGSVLLGIMVMLLDTNMEKWKRLYICSAILVLFPGFSFTYTLIFILIPLLSFMKNASLKRLDYWYLLLFGMIFWNYIVPSRTDLLGLQNVLYSLTYASLLQTFALIILYVTICVESLQKYIVYKRPNYPAMRGE